MVTQHSAVVGCLTPDVLTLESFVTDPGPISASREDGLAAYDARFALARDRLVRICAGFVGADAAEDVVHDTYLRGRSRWRQLRDEDLFEGWLTRIAINLCMNRHRSRRRLLDLLPMVGARAPEAAGRDIGLRELVERLPPRERTLVVLHYGYGYQLEEIARMTGLSPVNVRTIVFRARRRLADQVRAVDT
jgi:RNA polymerase sigma-70 factor (ECF subfamily)